MGMLSTASNAFRGFLVAICASGMIMLVHLQHLWDDFVFTFGMLMAIIWVGSLIISSFMDVPISGGWRPIAIAIHAGILAIFTTLIMVLLFYGGEITTGVFMLFDIQLLVLLIANALIMLVSSFLGYTIVPDPEMEMASQNWNK